MRESPQTIPLSGFDPAGEPEIHVRADGGLCLVFNFMPPSDMKHDEESFFAHFDEAMQGALGVTVIREDRERFLIQSPGEDTLDRLTTFVKECRRNLEELGPLERKQGVRATIHQKIDAIVAPRGFRLRKKDEAFVRAIPGAKQLLYVGCDDYAPVYRFSLTLGIRLDEVQAIVNRFTGVAREYMNQTLTTITQLEYFGLDPEPGRGVGFWIESAADVDAALQKMVPLIENQILPFFERFQSVASLDKALHEGTAPAGSGTRWWQRVAAPIPKRTTPKISDEWLSRRRSLNSTNHANRPITGIVIAHLAGNDRFEDWVTHYRNEVAIFSDADKQKFEKLVEYLRQQRGPA